MNRLAAAVAGSGRYAVTRANLDVWLSVVGSGGSHALLDLPGHGKEGLLDVAGVLGRSLEEWDAQAVGKLLLFGSQLSGSLLRQRRQHVMRVHGQPPIVTQRKCSGRTFATV